MGDFFDFNNDGKLDSFERAMKDTYILNSVEELEKQNQSSGYGSSRPKNDFNPDSAGDHFLAAIGAGVLAVGTGFLGYYTISFSSFVGGLSFLAAIVFGIVTIYAIIKGISVVGDAKTHKCSGKIIIGILEHQCNI